MVIKMESEKWSAVSSESKEQKFELDKENEEVSSIDFELVNLYFREIEEIIKKDHGMLWDISLKAPFLFVDNDTKDVAANEPDLEGILKSYKNIYIGKFPFDNIAANYITNLGNKDFTMVLWRKYFNKLSRDVLFLHEIFHYHQQQLGLSYNQNECLNSHLDELEGRIYLKLEWEALNKALNSEGDKRKTAISDALTFRQYRQELYECKDTENRLMIYEGLAEYTGVVLSAHSWEEQIKYMNQSYEKIKLENSYVRTFAYYFGTAYSILLDSTRIDWKKNLTYNSDLGELLAKGYNLKISSNTEKERRKLYGYDQIYREEIERKSEFDKKMKEYEELLFHNSTVKILMSNAHIGFDPSILIPYQKIGTIYKKITISDTFGVLSLEKSCCLLSEDWKSAVIPAADIVIENRAVKGAGWKIELNKGYEIVSNGEDYLIQKIMI